MGLILVQLQKNRDQGSKIFCSCQEKFFWKFIDQYRSEFGYEGIFEAQGISGATKSNCDTKLSDPFIAVFTEGISKPEDWSRPKSKPASRRPTRLLNANFPCRINLLFYRNTGCPFCTVYEPAAVLCLQQCQKRSVAVFWRSTLTLGMILFKQYRTTLRQLLLRNRSVAKLARIWNLPDHGELALSLVRCAILILDNDLDIS